MGRVAMPLSIRQRVVLEVAARTFLRTFGDSTVLLMIVLIICTS